MFTTDKASDKRSPVILSPNYQPAACLLPDGSAFQVAVTSGLREGILTYGLVGTPFVVNILLLTHCLHSAIGRVSHPITLLARRCALYTAKASSHCELFAIMLNCSTSILCN